jgi:hypothetical protein
MYTAQKTARPIQQAMTAHSQTSGPAHPSPALPKRPVTDLLFALPFIALFWLNLAHHQMWLDELNAWGLAAASPTLRDLFANIHYEGHPWLWYFILWIPSRFTHAPVAMKWVEAIIGAAIYLIIALLSPFTRLQKMFFLLNYFVIFEYTVISRTYGLMLLFALLCVWRRALSPRSVIGNMALLGALANTDVTGILLSGALLLEYVHTYVSGPLHREIPALRVLTALVVYAAFLLVSVHTLSPAPDISWETTGHLFEHASSVPRLLHAIGDVAVAPWWPFASGYPAYFWNTDVEFHKSAVAFIPLVLAGYFWIFRRSPSLLLLIAAALLFAICFAHLVYIGYVRHWGLSVIAFLLALWIFNTRSPDDGQSPRRALSWVVYVFLVVGAVKGVAAVAAAWTHPFSETGNVAAWLRRQHLDHEPIAGASDLDLAGVAERLQRPVYFLNCNCVDTYMKFSHRRDGMTDEDVPPRIALALDRLHVSGLVLIMDNPLTPQQMQDLNLEHLQVEQLSQFTGSEDRFTFTLYRVQRLP